MRDFPKRNGPLFVLLAAMSMAFSFCHLMELPARIGWPENLWVGSTVIGGQHRMFGTLGAVIEVAAIAAILTWSYVVLREVRLVAGGLHLLALATWWLAVFPANRQFAMWLDASVPADWADWRDRWEYGLAVVAALKIIGLAALCQSALPKYPANA